MALIIEPSRKRQRPSIKDDAACLGMLKIQRAMASLDPSLTFGAQTQLISKFLKLSRASDGHGRMLDRTTLFESPTTLRSEPRPPGSGNWNRMIPGFG